MLLLLLYLQSYRASVEELSRRFKQEKRDQGNYVRVMQGFHAQALRLQMVLNRQNAMYYDVLNTLQRRKDHATSIASDTINLKARLDAANAPAPASRRRGHAPPPARNDTIVNEVSVLRIQLLKSGREVIFYKGECIRTPMGEGRIISIQPTEERLIIQLPYGKMFAHLSRAVCWCMVPNSDVQLLDLTSDDVLRQRWIALQSSLSLPTDVARSIRSIVSMPNDDEAATDKDDDQSNNDDGPATDEPTGTGTTSPHS